MRPGGPVGCGARSGRGPLCQPSRAGVTDVADYAAPGPRGGDAVGRPPIRRPEAQRGWHGAPAWDVHPARAVRPARAQAPPARGFGSVPLPRGGGQLPEHTKKKKLFSDKITYESFPATVKADRTRWVYEWGGCKATGKS